MGVGRLRGARQLRGVWRLGGVGRLRAVGRLRGGATQGHGTMGRLGICDQVKHHNHEDDVGGDRKIALAKLLSLQLDGQSSYID